MSTQLDDHIADAILSALCRIEGKLDAIVHRLTKEPTEEDSPNA